MMTPIIMIKLRKIIFYVLLSIYIVVTPWLILRMLGFVWHPASFRIVKTGLAIVESSPPGANVFVDGRRAPHLTPVTIHDLVPGNHFIRIEKDGFQDWVNHISIESSKVNLLPTVTLSPAS